MGGAGPVAAGRCRARVSFHFAPRIPGDKAARALPARAWRSGASLRPPRPCRRGPSRAGCGPFAARGGGWVGRLRRGCVRGLLPCLVVLFLVPFVCPLLPPSVRPAAAPLLVRGVRRGSVPSVVRRLVCRWCPLVALSLPPPPVRGIWAGIRAGECGRAVFGPPALGPNLCPPWQVAPLPAALRRHGSASGTRQAVGPGERPARRAPALLPVAGFERAVKRGRSWRWGRRPGADRHPRPIPGVGTRPKPAPATPAPKTAELRRSVWGAWAARRRRLAGARCGDSAPPARGGRRGPSGNSGSAGRTRRLAGRGRTEQTRGPPRSPARRRTGRGSERKHAARSGRRRATSGTPGQTARPASRSWPAASPRPPRWRCSTVPDHGNAPKLPNQGQGLPARGALWCAARPGPPARHSRAWAGGAVFPRLRWLRAPPAWRPRPARRLFLGGRRRAGLKTLGENHAHHHRSPLHPNRGWWGRAGWLRSARAP